MSMDKNIREIYKKIDTEPLSNILPLLLTISLELKDFEGYCMITYWGRPVSPNTKLNVALRNEMKKILSGEGLSLDKINELERTTFDKYLNLRSVEDGKVLCMCAKEMEDHIRALNDMLDAIELPQGLAPVDLYYKNETISKQKFTLIEGRERIEKQYSVLHSYIISKLTEYDRKIVIQKQKPMIQKEINNSKNVFIVHGHNEAKRRELEKLLKEKFDLNPIVLLEQPDQGLTIIEKFEKYAVDCSFAFALFTPDDIVIKGEQQYFQARPNVIFELGWFYAKLGRSRVCILDQASEESKIFSDLQGVIRMQFNDNISEKYMEIERELKSLGII